MGRVIVIICIIVFSIFILSMVGYLSFNLIDIRHTQNVMDNYMIIFDAIHKYRMDMHHRGIEPVVEYDDMRNIRDSYKKFWDWGYKHILPPDKYELIEKYIER